VLANTFVTLFTGHIKVNNINGHICLSEWVHADHVIKAAVVKCSITTRFDVFMTCLILRTKCKSK